MPALRWVTLDTDYQLEDLHPTYVAVVQPMFSSMSADYPACQLSAVKLFRGSLSDRSMASADEPGVIQLNSYWFSDRPLEDLREEARQGYLFCLPGSDQMIKWHGGMVEPQHVLAHEFGHLLSDALPGWRRWAEPRYQAATADPRRAITGYALTGVDEFWAECFAAMYLRIDLPLCAELWEFLSGQ